MKCVAQRRVTVAFGMLQNQMSHQRPGTLIKGSVDLVFHPENAENNTMN
jgi:hypothetical protein